MEKPKLFYAARACSLGAMVALDWAGIDYDPLEVVLAGDRGELRPYSAEARVPALVIDKRVITENVAIFVWAAQQRPAANLLPTGEAAIEAFSLMGWLASRLHIVRRAYVLPQHFSADPVAHASIKQVALPKYRDGLAALEQKIAEGAVTAPALKAYALVFARWAAVDEINLAPYPNLVALAKNLARDRVVQAALARHKL